MKDKQIENKLDELLNCSTVPLSINDKKSVVKAFEFANKKYEGRLLPNGDPYVYHGMEVAITSMREIGLGPTSAICSLLHGLVIDN